MSDSVTYLRARHVATMTATGVIEDGCVAIVDGRIAAIGRTRDLQPPKVDQDIDGLLTPGLINAHTHLELTNVPRPQAPGMFQNWLLTTMGSMREPDLATFNAKREGAVREGIAQCLKFGITFVGDISQNVDIVRPILRDAPIRSISYGECLGLGERRSRFEELLKRAADPAAGSARMKVGISPHAPYTVEPVDYQRAMQAAEQAGGFVTTHLLETPDEDAFLDSHGGPFAAMYQTLGFNPGPGEPWRQGTLAKAQEIGLLGQGVLLAHMNYVKPNQMHLLRAAKSRVVWCPRTHAYFGHPPHPWRAMTLAGVTVCVGTDSCASSPDLNVMDDLRLVRQQSPEVDAETIWSLATDQAARAMSGKVSQNVPACGSLTPGNEADFIAWPTRTAEPLAEVLDTPGMLPRDVWIAGVRRAEI